MAGKRLVYVVGLVALAVVTFFVYRYLQPDVPANRAASPSPYINPATCAGCHAEIAKTYRQTGMGRAFARPNSSNLIEDYEADNRFYHQPSDRYYTMIRRGDRLFQRRHQIGWDGKETNVVEVEVNYILGSGNHARSYLRRTGEGKLVELPVGWYSEKNGFWAMGPGYDRPDHPDFRREVSYDCMFCHNGYPAVAPGEGAGGKEPFYPETLPEGIDCQRCHGPGREHAERAAASGSTPESIRAAIVNPARLDRDRQMEVCLQCHLETTSRALPHAIRRYDRDAFSYRPDQPLAGYALHFDRADATPENDTFEIAHAAYRLRQSACFQNSAMTCTTCHNPHDVPRGETAGEHYVKVCRSCHEQPHPAADARSGDCLTCHMPKRRTDDVVHVVMTDHYIQRKKPARDLLAPIKETHDTETNTYRGEVVSYYPPQAAGPEDELYLAVAQVQNGAGFESGIPRLERALQAQPDARGEFHFELAEAYRKTGQPEKAIPSYQEALRRKPGYRPAVLHLALSLSRTNRLSEAAELLEQAAKTLGPDAGLSNNRGEVYLLQGNLDAGERVLRQALARNPDLPEANNLLGTALARKGDAAGAEAAYRAALRSQPDFALAHSNLANLLARGGDLLQARYHFEKAIAADPTFADAHYNYGVALAEHGLMPEARTKLEAAVKLKPDFAEAHNDLANLLASTGHIDSAIPHFQRAIELRPQMPEAHFNLGTALGSIGRTSEAIRHFQEAIRLNPNYHEAHFNLAQTLMAQGNPTAARDHLAKAAQSQNPQIRQAALQALGAQ